MLLGNILGGPRRQIKDEKDFACTKHDKMDKMLESELIMNISSQPVLARGLFSNSLSCLTKVSNPRSFTIISDLSENVEGYT